MGARQADCRRRAEPRRCGKDTFCFGVTWSSTASTGHQQYIESNCPHGGVSCCCVFVCVFFLPFPFPFSVFVAHLLQSTSLQEPKLNKLPICHASLVVCSPHCHLAYLLSQKEKERERKSRKEGGGGEEGKEKQGRGRGGRGREIREGGTQANEEREKGGGEPDTMRRQG